MPGNPLNDLRKRARRGFRGFPVATVAFYGPTNEFASKAVASIVASEGAEPAPLERWYGAELDVRHDRAVGQAIAAFVKEHGARSVTVTRGIIGCPHEEGTDYPLDGVCPRCPFWADRDRWREA